MSFASMKISQMGKCRFGALAVILLIIVGTILSSCHKNKAELDPAGTLRFVFLADSRGDSPKNLINTPVLTAIIKQIGALKPKPAFVIFGGDMSFRGYSDTNFTFQSWKDLFTPLIESGIPLYTAIGNHELYTQNPHGYYFRANQTEFQNVFSENPGNGPPGYERLVYSFTDPGTNSFFVVLDPYYVDADSLQMNLGGNINDTEMEWLKTQVSQTKAIHKFLFIHTPYYYVCDDPEEPSEANKTFTELWSFVDASKFDFYACGHLHLYSRKTIDSSITADPQTTPPTPTWKNNVVQLLNGTCGADPATTPIDSTITASWHVCNKDETFYYSVVDISGDTVFVNSYKGNTGDYTLFDTFTIVK